jgi:hypothetical protein
MSGSPVSSISKPARKILTVLGDALQWFVRQAEPCDSVLRWFRAITILALSMLGVATLGVEIANRIEE